MKRVEDYIGIAWESMDCWDLAVAILRDHFGIRLSDLNYSVSAPGHELWSLVDSCRRDWHGVIKPEAGDVVLFRFLGGRPHIGVFLNNCEFIHSTRYAGVCVERLNSMRWKRRIEGCYRHNSRRSS